MNADLPLKRLRVIDLTRVRAGPTATRYFADWGADVIMVEPRQDLDDIVGVRDSSDFQNLNRNKRSICIDLKSEEGRDLLRRFVEHSDVLFENFRPDVKHRLGIDYETLRRINPRLVYTSISGFGQDGPYSDRPGLDQIAQGMGGLMAVTGEPGEGPMRAGIAVADSSAGLYAAIGTLTALLEREATGEGRWVKTSLLQAQIAMMDFQAARWLSDRVVPKQAGNDHPTAVPMGLFPTLDGHVNLAASGTALFERFCKTVGCEHLLDDDRFIMAARPEHRQELNEEIAKILKTHSSAYWIEKLNAAGVPCGPVYEMDEVFSDPQVRHLAIAQSVDHPRRGELTLVGQPVEIDGVEVQPRSAAPDPGQDTLGILSEFGYSAEQAQDLVNRGIV